MRIFLSYPSEQRHIADRIRLALMADGHKVFFDRSELLPGEAFDSAIRRNIQRSDLFVFLVSPESVAKGAYTISELKLAQAKWPHPSGHILPIKVFPTDIDLLPAYIRSVTVFEPEGDLVAEAAAAVAQLEVRRQKKWILPVAVLTVLLAAAAAFYIFREFRREQIDVQIDTIIPHSRGYFAEPDRFTIKGFTVNRSKENELLTGIRGEVENQDVRLELSLAFDEGSTEIEAAAGRRGQWAALASFTAAEEGFNLRVENVPKTNWRVCLEFVDHEKCSDWLPWRVTGNFDHPPPHELSKKIGSGIRRVASLGAKFLAAAVKPNRLLRLSKTGQVEKSLSLKGEPVAIASDGARIVVAMQIPNAVVVIDALEFQQRSLSSIPEISINVGDLVEQLSSRPEAISITASAIWLTTAGGSGAEGLLYSKDGGQTWQAPEYYDGFNIDARDLRLRAKDRQLWGVTKNTSPSSIYLINEKTFVEFGGHDYEDVSCAEDMVILSQNRFIIRDCEFQLIELEQQSKQLVKTASFGRILVKGEAKIGAEAWTQQIMVRDDDVTVIAVTEYPIMSEIPTRSGIAMQRKNSQFQSLMEAEKIEILDIAITDGNVIVVIRKADGSYQSTILTF